MPPVFQRKIPLALATAVIFLAGSGAGFWRYLQTRDAMLAKLIITAKRSAVAFEPAELKALTGTADDMKTSAYNAIKERLIRLCAVQPDVRLVYIFRQIPTTGRIIFLADSEPAGSKEMSLPGDGYPEAAKSPGLQSIIANGQPATEGPLRDQFGTRVTAYALIGHPGPGEPREIFGLDAAADSWHRTLWNAALATASYIWILLALPLAIVVSTRRELQQRDALRNLTEAMEQSYSAVMIVDLKGRIEYANAGFCRQIGYSRRELIGREWRDFQGKETPLDLIADLIATVRAGRSWSGEWMMRRKDGSLYPVRGAVTPVTNRAGVIRSYVAVFEDMTAIRQTENVLREAKNRAEAGDRAKGQFLATMSHEVRTPLNGIVGFASLLLETGLTSEQREFVETIRTSSESLIQLTGDILDYARIESGGLKLEPQPCDPRECVENALDLIAASAARKGIELLHWIEDDVPPAIVADVNRLRQVLVNLANNALKFTASGEIEIRVRSLPPPEPGDSSVVPPDATPGPLPCVLEFSVRDTGIGIAAEHRAKLFRPFTQVDETTTRRFGGTGLGLAICKNIVELMGGKISFVSEPGHGSTFTFTIVVPAHPAEATPPLRPLLHQRLAVATTAPGLRAELMRLGTRLGAEVTEVDAAALASTPTWNLAVIDVDEKLAMEIAATGLKPARLPAERVVALVPITLPAELRAALIAIFRLVLNKPLHHDMFASLLGAAASISAAPFGTAPEDFGLEVLIVEDNAVNQRLVQKMLSKIGCRWTAAGNGRIALEELNRATYDVVLMDLHMPELDGLGAITRIRGGETRVTNADVWIVALTADARADQKTRVLEAGANDYLTKPVRLPELTGALQRFRSARRS